VSARIWLIRHGETEWSRAGRHTGRTDLPLTSAGEDQARAAGAGLSHVTPGLVLCSPLSRAKRTAVLAGLTPDAFDDDLMEWDYGAWEGLTTSEIRDLRGDPGWRVWDEPIPPGATPGSTPGEQLADVRARALRVIVRCTPTLDVGQDCVLVAHGHLLRILTATWLDLPPDAARLFALEPAHRSSLGFEREQQVIMSWNA
jgi:broad specificity phosphatase PhoE